ncbi:hypothetical protein SpCBS45565_g06817 [Spizellomyces sp. 'palustris']|nr:hypothetical protein SpCBS45565_g06817 [Spizellomyces sp. 'palustris']
MTTHVPGRVTLALTLHRATNLPKTDRIEHIDPYVKVSFQSTQSCKSQKSRALSNTPDPVWNERLIFSLEEMVVTGGHTVMLEIYDEDTFRDERVGFVEVTMTRELFRVVAGKAIRHQFPIIYVKSKHNTPAESYLEVSFSCVYSYDTVARWVQNNISGSVCNFMDKRLYVPFPPEWNGLLLGLEFENGGDKIDFKVFTTIPDGGMYVDLALTSEAKSRIRRRGTATGEPTPIKGTHLRYYEEVKLDDVPIETDWNMVAVWKFKKSSVESIDLAKIVQAHGWKGTLSYQGAARTLQGVELDPQDETVYFPLPSQYTFTTEDSVEPSSFVLVDWDKNNCDMKILVLDTPSNAGVGYDLTITGVEYNKKTSDVYVPPRPILGGRYRATRRVELDDVPYGVPLSNIKWEKLRLEEGRELRVGQFIKLTPW